MQYCIHHVSYIHIFFAVWCKVIAFAEFTYIYSRFLDQQLPLTMNEFMYNLKLVFPCIFDVELLMKEIGLKTKNLPASSAYLSRQFFAKGKPLSLYLNNSNFLFSDF